MPSSIGILRETLSRRKSSKHGRAEDLFVELVSFPELAAHRNFTLEVALTREEEIKAADNRASWRRRGWRAIDRRLIEVVERIVLAAPSDYAAFLPPALPPTFTCCALSEANGQALQSIAGQYALVYGYVVTDTADPWKVYAPNPTPAWVNDLTALSFGSYWISATQPVTLHLGAPSNTESGVGPFPPSTFYGFVQANSLFTPTVNMDVEAWVNGTLCAQTKTRDVSLTGVIAFVIDVADEGFWQTAARRAAR